MSSEYTNYIKLRTSADTLEILRAELERTVGAADVVLDELLGEASYEAAEAQNAWSKLCKPVWIMLMISKPVDNLSCLAEIGPAFHLLVEADFSSWTVAVHNGTSRWHHTCLLSPEVYRGVTEQYDSEENTMDLADVAQYLGVDTASIENALIPDGGEAFSTCVGTEYHQMELLEEPESDTVVFSFDWMDD